ncbi:MAG: serine/threonine-protein kinase, partial [Myxococcota bacterium]
MTGVQAADDPHLPARLPRPPPGFTELAWVGSGATSRVFRATEVRTGLPVALKRMHRRFVGDEQALARMRREFEALSRLRHPGLVAVRDVIKWQGDPTVVMDYVDGVDLKERLREGPLAFGEVERIARALMDVLVVTHGAGIVHRDVKPQNVRLAVDGRVFLLDFGSARLDATSELTATGTSVGTPDYMAPELFAGSVYDPRVDVYGLGATLFEACTGRLPQVASSLSELAFKRNREAVPLVRAIRSEVPQALAQLIDRALRRRPEARFASMALMRWALDHPRAELAFQRRRARRPGCLHCGGPLDPKATICAHCGSDHPFHYEAGHSHIDLKHVTDVDRFAIAFGRRFPEWTHPSSVQALGERVASLDERPQRLLSFVRFDEAKALARALEEEGTATCEVVEDGGTAEWRRLGGALTLFLVATVVVTSVVGVSLGWVALAALAMPALVMLFGERSAALMRAEQGMIVQSRFPAGVHRGWSAALAAGGVGLLSAGLFFPAVFASAAWVSSPLIAVGVGLVGGAMSVALLPFRRPR